MNTKPKLIMRIITTALILSIACVCFVSTASLPTSYPAGEARTTLRSFIYSYRYFNEGKYPEYYGGDYFTQDANKYRILHVQVCSGHEDEFQQIREELEKYAGYVVYETVTHSYQELKTAVNDVADEFEANGISVSYAEVNVEDRVLDIGINVNISSFENAERMMPSLSAVKNLGDIELLLKKAYAQHRGEPKFPINSDEIEQSEKDSVTTPENTQTSEFEKHIDYELIDDAWFTVYHVLAEDATDDFEYPYYFGGVYLNHEDGTLCLLIPEEYKSRAEYLKGYLEEYSDVISFEYCKHSYREMLEFSHTLAVGLEKKGISTDGGFYEPEMQTICIGVLVGYCDFNEAERLLPMLESMKDAADLNVKLVKSSWGGGERGPAVSTAAPTSAETLQPDGGINLEIVYIVTGSVALLGVCIGIVTLIRRRSDSAKTE